VPYEHLRQQLDAADEAMDKARFVGDLVVAAFFSAEKDKAREERLREMALRLVKYLGPGGKMEDRQPLAEAVRQLRSGNCPVPAFHWEIEFPEVFGQGNPGFDAIVGNPPFAGVVTLAQSVHPEYTNHLRMAYPNSGGKCDLVAFFFRRSYELLKREGTFGLLATKTVRQGDTRESGLGELLIRHGATVYTAFPRLRWPGQAAVVVAVVHVLKGRGPVSAALSGRPVRRISAYLVQGDVDHSPYGLTADKVNILAALGNKPNGKGFVLDAEQRQTLEACHQVIKPYLGGSELNEWPNLVPRRWIIDLQSFSEEEASRYGVVWEWVKQNVKPYVRRENWWQFEHRAVALYQKIHELRLCDVLAVAEASDTLAFRIVPANWSLSNTLVAFSDGSMPLFAVLQSRVHEVWCRLVSSSLKDDLRYVPADCFETFPLPLQWRVVDEIGRVASEYYETREALMVRNNEGLTKTYNRFHDPNETSPDILKLRELHAAMDRAVLDAYGWTDLEPTCEFLLDYEEEDEDENGGSSKRRKPWRYRWPDEFRDEVLARLLELNKQRAEEEAIAGLTAEAATKKAGKGKSGKKRKDGGEDQPLLR
jgi:hypothetical protein